MKVYSDGESKDAKNNESDLKLDLSKSCLQDGIQNCQTEPQILIKVEAEVQSLTLVAMHPQNDTYPIFSAQIDLFRFNFNMHFDHDVHEILMHSIAISDHTCYPKTLDPATRYSAADKMHSQDLLVRRGSSS